MNRSPHFPPSALILALAVLPSAASAIEPIRFEVRDNADLVALCATPTIDPNYVAAIHFCHGVGVGFARYHEALQEGKDFHPVFCLPKAVTRSQALSEYVRYSKGHPEYDRETVGDVVIKFLSETYPCPHSGAVAKP